MWWLSKLTRIQNAYPELRTTLFVVQWVARNVMLDDHIGLELRKQQPVSKTGKKAKHNLPKTSKRSMISLIAWIDFLFRALNLGDVTSERVLLLFCLGCHWSASMRMVLWSIRSIEGGRGQCMSRMPFLANWAFLKRKQKEDCDVRVLGLTHCSLTVY